MKVSFGTPCMVKVPSGRLYNAVVLQYPAHVNTDKDDPDQRYIDHSRAWVKFSGGRCCPTLDRLFPRQSEETPFVLDSHGQLDV